MEMFCLVAFAAVGVFLTWRQWRDGGKKKKERKSVVKMTEIQIWFMFWASVEGLHKSVRPFLGINGGQCGHKEFL